MFFMRIILKKGLQKKLILLAKSNMTWSELAKILHVTEHYLAVELGNELRTLSEERYNALCKIVDSNYDCFIVKRLDDNWGRSKGGINSDGSTKELIEPKESRILAELVGVVLGDGHIDKYQVGRRVRRYAIEIAGHIEEDENYVKNYVSKMLEKLFDEKPKIKLAPKYGGVYAVLYGKKIVEFFEKEGIKPGNKKTNNQGIPNWIISNKDYLRVCLRGLIDTDGSVHYISKNNKNLRISFTSYIPKLITDVRDSFIKLGYHPSKIIREKQIFISRKEEIDKYIKEIGFGNQKHLKRIKRLKVMLS